MRGRVELFVVLTVVWVVLIMVYEVRETTKLPQMTFP
jgi:hypothetical protein